MLDPMRQIFPLRIVRFDQFKLLGPFPFLDPGLTLPRIVQIFVTLEPYQCRAAIILRKTGLLFLSVLGYPPSKVACHSDIDRAVALACKNIDPTLSRKSSPTWAPAFAGAQLHITSRSASVPGPRSLP
jgi:hypothetical protein